MRLDRESLQAASYSTVGLEFVVSVLFGFFGGRWLDGRLGTDPVLAVVGLGFGVAAGFRFVYRAAQRMKRQTENDSFRAADAGRSARFALTERHGAARASREARSDGARESDSSSSAAARHSDE